MFILDVFTIFKLHEVFCPDLLVGSRLSLDGFFCLLEFRLGLIAIGFDCFDIIRVSKLRREL